VRRPPLTSLVYQSEPNTSVESPSSGGEATVTFSLTWLPRRVPFFSCVSFYQAKGC
jgi:hypothetical protein